MTMQFLQPGRIAVVSGGRSTERERSLMSGRAAQESLDRQGYTTVLLDAASKDFADQVRGVDVAFLAIAGQYAEDGKLQGLLESLNIPYTGSGVTASAIGMHKTFAKTVATAAGVAVLPSVNVPAGDRDTITHAITSTMAFPLILKPLSEGGSIGMTVCHDTAQLAAALPTVKAADGWFAEPFITGTPVTCGILEVDGSPVALPPLETLPTDAEFYDYATKRDKTKYRYRCPAGLPSATLDAITTASLTAHNALACTGYSRSDFIVAPDGSPVWLEINTLPGLSQTGNLATMAAAAGIDYDQLIRMILATATTSERYRP
ncbi:D-alanine--D-alanine ligase (plasmid) [Streptomyces sp. NBC_00053]|uniref:D-alanine--D-alanine ligase family protein n=1 Tax=unclassified Streptomyces TaxID=2593676 RepID=UPI002253A15A|nr:MULTISPECIES: D-alanine--D-alanine ligase [unclassified Streptomyces]MCX4399943.1 D-alanine--D-alanine ligase [Streptomyces sp. NBC_01767]MCX5506053.1 D-alanine--D-alanine ligase [Streptomyces sp. NBC_00052]MCX5554292.1 D-alanine--D-alanine ligase [Streptomyces sp. NBC_00051]WSP52956.1 D-alanine--D-alanine ligase [Streptomyces sp. NBC_01243]